MVGFENRQQIKEPVSGNDPTQAKELERLKPPAIAEELRQQALLPNSKLHNLESSGKISVAPLIHQSSLGLFSHQEGNLLDGKSHTIALDKNHPDKMVIQSQPGMTVVAGKLQRDRLAGTPENPAIENHLQVRLTVGKTAPGPDGQQGKKALGVTVDGSAWGGGGTSEDIIHRVVPAINGTVTAMFPDGSKVSIPLKVPMGGAVTLAIVPPDGTRLEDVKISYTLKNTAFRKY